MEKLKLSDLKQYLKEKNDFEFLFLETSVASSFSTTSLMAAKPTILSQDTIFESSFILEKELKNIIIIENLTVFTTLLQRNYYDRKDTIVLLFYGAMELWILEQ